MTPTLGAAAVAETVSRNLSPPAAPSAAPATYYVVQGGNDIYWRVEGPAKAVGAKVAVLPERGTVENPGAYFAVTQPNDDSVLPWRLLVNRNDPDDWELEFPEHQGVAIWTRPDLARATLAKGMREKLEIRTLAELDDNYASDPRFNVFMQWGNWSPQERSDHLRAVFSHDGVVFSTEWLRDYYWRIARDELGLEGRMPKMFVCRNNVAAEDWPEPIPRDGPLRVGWMGSPSHVWDVDLCAAAMLRAHEHGCDVWMIGYDPRNPKNAGVLPKHASRRKHHIWRRIPYTYRFWIKPERYHRTPLPFDIGLCPLLPNEHTDGKSDVKALEYGMSGAAVIAQNTVVYNRTLVHGETALLVNGPGEMAQAVTTLVRQPRLREQLAANLQQYIREERNGDVMKKEWLDAIDG